MNKKEIAERIKETQTWNSSFEKTMALRALHSILSKRHNQVLYDEDKYLERADMMIPSFWDKLFHCLVHTWLEYENVKVFDGNRRICLVCGLVQTSPLQRQYGYETYSYNQGLNLVNLLKFIKAYKNPYSDYWRKEK